jgi:hypothetical protein
LQAGRNDHHGHVHAGPRNISQGIVKSILGRLY